MYSNGKYRKLVKHYHEPGDLHELTFSCFHRLQLLVNDQWRKWLAEAINVAGQKHRFELLAFVFAGADHQRSGRPCPCAVPAVQEVHDGAAL